MSLTILAAKLTAENTNSTITVVGERDDSESWPAVERKKDPAKFVVNLFGMAA